MKHSRSLMAGLALFLLLLSLLFSSCGEVKSGAKYLIADKNSYSELLLSVLPEYSLLDETGKNLGCVFSHPDSESIAPCLDVQLSSKAMSDKNLQFYPHCLLTVVFAVDRDLTDMRPAGWKELLSSGLSVSYPLNGKESLVFRRAALASIAYGLEGNDYEKDSALEYLKKLRLLRLLDFGDKSCAVSLCFDTQAAEMIKNGKNIEIIVPEEGTLSFSLGFVGPQGLPSPSDEDLIAAGLRLTDGRCNNELYPAADKYSSAARVSDFERFRLVSENCIRDLRREIMHIRLFNSADGRENIIIIVCTILLILLWTVTALHRSSQKSLRNMIWLISGMIVVWLMLCMIKYMLYELSLLSRILWYSYYIFLMGLPFAALYLSVSVGNPAAEKRVPRWFIPFAVLYPLLLALVFTNDFHQLVFRFDLGGSWSREYSYGPGYFAVLCFAVLSFVLSLAILIFKSRKNPKSGSWLMPGFIAILLIAFNLGYIYGLPICRDSNLSLVISVFSVLFVEALLNSGLIPVNIGYRKIFASSPLNMQLLDIRGNTVLRSSSARELSRFQRLSILSSPGRPYEIDENTLLHSCPIRGGLAVWQEDISALNTLRKKLQDSAADIEKANTILQREQDIKRSRFSTEANEQLFARLEADIKDQTDELAEIVKKLSAGKSSKAQLSYISLLLCHIKRRSNLFFLSQQTGIISGSGLSMYLDELSEFASYAGIQALVRCGGSGDISVSAAGLCYDFYFFLLRSAFKHKGITLIGTLEYNGGLSFSIVSSDTVGMPDFPASFTELAERLNAVLSCRALEDRQNFLLSLPALGGEAD